MWDVGAPRQPLSGCVIARIGGAPRNTDITPGRFVGNPIERSIQSETVLQYGGFCTCNA